MKLDAMSFIQRFLQHVLPRGFQKVRYFGFLHPSAKKRFHKLKEQFQEPASETNNTPEPESAHIVAHSYATSGDCPDVQRLRCPSNISAYHHANSEQKDEYSNTMANSLSGTKNHAFPGHRRSAPPSRNFPNLQQDSSSVACVAPVKERSASHKSLEDCSVYPC